MTTYAPYTLTPLQYDGPCPARAKRGGDYREDDAQAILDAIAMIRGVIAVTPEIATGDDWMNRQRIQLELRKRVMDPSPRRGSGQAVLRDKEPT